MAIPRLFISSTYYDLRYVRADLAVLAEQMALEVVRFETGAIAYHTAETLSDACCREIDNCEIMVTIIGGRYGSVVETTAQAPAKTTQKTKNNLESNPKRTISISRLEVERAIQSGLLLFTFIDDDVLAEYRTYCKNKDNADVIKWTTVDTVLVFEFIDFIYNLEGGNPVFSFKTPNEIQDFLRKQLSGLFYDLLLRGKLKEYASHIDQVIQSAEKLETLQTRLRDREKEAEERLKEMLLPDHPFYDDIKQTIGSQFRIFFKNKSELFEILRNFGYEEVNPNEIQSEKAAKMMFFHNPDMRTRKTFIGISRDLFTESGEVKLPSHDNWDGKGIRSGKTI